jgi:hypothetical protein
MAEQVDVRIAMKQFLEWCPHREYDFPLGGTVPILSDAEHRLVGEITMAMPIATDAVQEIRAGLSRLEAYALVIFAIRSAVAAVRCEDSVILRAGLVGIVIDDELVDWRDILRALALIESCAGRLKVEFAEAIHALSEAFATRGRRETVRGYLERTPDMRRAEVMGYTATGEGRDFAFAKRF